MSGTFLDRVIAETRARVAALKTAGDMAALQASAEKVRAAASANAFRKAIARRDRVNIIAEIKRRSPSKGVISETRDVVKLATDYAAGGAAAISVLTEMVHFAGSLDDLRAVRSVGMPTLRKDFIVDEFQIYEAAEAGADAVLLIVGALSKSELTSLLALTRYLKMDALVEVHTAEEIKTAARVGAEIIGVNNRDLQSLEVSIDVSRSLVKERPDNVLMVSESGLASVADIAELRGLGFDAFLIGEPLMRSAHPAMALHELSGGVTV